MVKVPIKTQPTVQQAGAPRQRISVQATPDNFGAIAARSTAALGQQLGQASDQVQAIAMDMKKTEEDNTFQQAKLAYEHKVTQRLYGDGQTEGTFQKRAQQGVEDARAARADLQKYAQELLDQYKGTAVGTRLANAIGLSQEGNMRDLFSFEHREQKVYRQELSDSMKKNEIDRATRGRHDPQVVRMGEERLKVIVNEDRAANGWDPATYQAKEREALSTYYAGIIEGAHRSGDVLGADELLKKYKNKMDAGVAAQLEYMLKDATNIAMAQKESDRIMAAPTDNAGRYAMAKEIQNPEVRKLAESLIDTNIRRNAANYKAQVEGYTESALQFVRNGGSWVDWKLKHGAEATHIERDSEAFKNIQAAQKAYKEGRIYSDVSDPDLYQRLMTMEPSQMSKLTDQNLQAVRGRLSREDYAKAMTRLASSRQAFADDQTSSEPYRRANSLLRTLSPSGFGFRAQDPGKDQIQRVRQATGEMQDWVYNYVQTHHKQPSEAEMASKVRSLYVIYGQGLLSTDKSAVMLRAGGVNTSQIDWKKIDLTDSEMDPFYVSELRASIAKQIGQASASDDQVKQMIHLLANGASVQEQRKLLDSWKSQPRKPQQQGALPVNPKIVPAGFTVHVQNAEHGAPVPGRKPLDKAGQANTQHFEGGFSPSVYTDSMGKPTIGYGFNLARRGAKQRIAEVGADYNALLSGRAQLTQDQATRLFKRDYAESRQSAQRIVKNFDELSPNRRTVVIDMIYNLGAKKFSGFTETIKAIKRGDFEAAALEMRRSKWYHQTGTRAKELVKMMLEG